MKQLRIPNHEFDYILIKGYETSLIPMLVQGVPSMHVCLDFIPKLLSNADVNTQVTTSNLRKTRCHGRFNSYHFSGFHDQPHIGSVRQVPDNQNL